MLNFSVERDPSSQVERNGWPMANDDSKLPLRPVFSLSAALPPAVPPSSSRRSYPVRFRFPFCLLFKSPSFPRFPLSRKVRDSPADFSRKGVKKKQRGSHLPSSRFLSDILVSIKTTLWPVLLLFREKCVNLFPSVLIIFPNLMFDRKGRETHLLK